MKTKDITRKLQETNFNDMLVVDEMPELHFGDIIKVGQDGIDLLKQADQAADQEIENDAMCNELNAAGKVISHNRGIIEKLRVSTKKPYLDGGRTVDDQFKIALGVFDPVILKIRKATTKYTSDKAAALKAAQDEVDRKNRELEEAARKKEETNKKISIAKGGTGEVKPVEAEVIAAPIAKIDMSGTTVVKTYKAHVIDPASIPLSILISDRVMEAMRIEAQSMVNENRKRLGKMCSEKDFTPIPGIEIKEEKNTRF